MTSDITIFDRRVLRQRRARSARRLVNHDFLLRHAAEEVRDRLQAINRTFPVALDLGCHSGGFGQLAQKTWFNEKIGLLINGDTCFDMVRQANSPRLVLDEECLPLAPESLNLVISLLTLHWVNDLPGALWQIRRALQPDGLFVGALFGGNTLTELRQALTEAELDMEGGASPRISPFADVRALGGLLQRAEFALPVVDTDRLTVTYAHPLKLMHELRGMGETNVLIDRRRTPLRRATLQRACEIYQEKFSDHEGRIKATFEIIYMTGWAPHESQQKPLRPGSAATRLADALGVEELPTGDNATPAPDKGKT